MADVLAVRNEYRLQNWMEIIRECQASGLSNREFCSQRGISEKTYYYWLRKVRTAAATIIEPQLYLRCALLSARRIPAGEKLR